MAAPFASGDQPPAHIIIVTLANVVLQGAGQEQRAGFVGSAARHATTEQHLLHPKPAICFATCNMSAQVQTLQAALRCIAHAGLHRCVPLACPRVLTTLLTVARHRLGSAEKPAWQRKLKGRGLFTQYASIAPLPCSARVGTAASQHPAQLHCMPTAGLQRRGPAQPALAAAHLAGQAGAEVAPGEHAGLGIVIIVRRLALVAGAQPAPGACSGGGGSDSTVTRQAAKRIRVAVCAAEQAAQGTARFVKRHQAHPCRCRHRHP